MALPRYFRDDLFLHGITSFDPLSFLQANPKICEKVRRLKLKGKIWETSPYKYYATTPLDDTVVVGFLQLLPKVERLDLWCFIYAHPPPQASRAASHIGRPRRLRSCHVWFGEWLKDERDSSVSGLSRILSLFSSIRELRVRNSASKFSTSPPLDPAVLFHRHHRFRVRSISIKEDVARDLDSLGGTLKLVNAFEASTEPGILRALSVRCSSVAEVVAVGELIAHARGALKTLDVGAEAQRFKSEQTNWEDPLDGHWERLGLASCSKLECVEVHIHFRADSGDQDAPQPQQDEDVRGPSLAAIGFSSQVSSTLREITIWLHGLPHATGVTLGLFEEGRLLGLQAFDEAITADAFPRLKVVDVRMRFEPSFVDMCGEERREILEAVRWKALPNLKRGGLLRVV
ncbi:hypothetical protein LXA43DRAFT_1098921 [Ganoderma leucocontextum]|nr:hypothetical protein LXA43DRAFT_1098921 [Ganoderma leucocontextum]